MLVAQITDLHLSTPGATLHGGYRPDRAVARVLARVTGLDPRPDFVWLTGDLVEHGRAEEYANLRRALADLDLPMAAIPGNHDARTAFAAALAGGSVAIGREPFLHLAIEDHPLRMLGLDTLAGPGAFEGALCPARLAWLDERLAEAPGRPTIVFMHHPPFPTGIGFMDSIRCLDGDALAEVLARHRQVVGLVCGHVHRAIATTWAGVPATIAPSVAWMVPLALAPGGGTELVPQAPGFGLHLWSDGRLVSHAELLAGE
jgi:3',5'-cyclic AMP phosphodiesterase CpdA